MPLQHAVQGQEAKNREGELQDDKGHRYRPELVVERHGVEPELVEAPEDAGKQVRPAVSAAQGQKYAHHGRNQHPPFCLAFWQAQAQDKQKDSYSPYVHWTGRERLRSPIHGQGLCHLAGIGLAVLF